MPPYIKRPNERQQRAIDFLNWKGPSSSIEDICIVAEIQTEKTAITHWANGRPVHIMQDGAALFICRMIRSGYVDVYVREGEVNDPGRCVTVLGALRKGLGGGDVGSVQATKLRELINKGWVEIYTTPDFRTEPTS